MKGASDNRDDMAVQAAALLDKLDVVASEDECAWLEETLSFWDVGDHLRFKQHLTLQQDNANLAPIMRQLGQRLRQDKETKMLFVACLLLLIFLVYAYFV